MRTAMCILVVLAFFATGNPGSLLFGQPSFEVAAVRVNRTGSSNSRFPELRNDFSSLCSPILRGFAVPD